MGGVALGPGDTIEIQITATDSGAEPSISFALEVVAEVQGGQAIDVTAP